MWDRLRIDKKLGIERKYVDIGIVTVAVGIALFAAYEIVSRSGSYLTIIKDLILEFLRVISPIISAAIVAYLLFPAVCFIEKKLKSFNISKRNEKYNWIYRCLSIVIVFLIIIILVVVIFNFIIPPLIENTKSLIINIPQYESIIRKDINNINSYFISLNIDYQQISGYVDKITAIFPMVGEQIVNTITNSISIFGSFIIDFVLAVVLTFYFLKDKEMLFKTIKKFGKAFIPGKLGEKLKQFIIDLDKVVGGFVRGVLLDALIVGIVSSILMLVINHPFAILVGTIAGICNIIPYIGPLVGAVVALLLGAFTSVTTGVWGFVLLILYQQVDGNIVAPKIIGDSVGLPAVWTIIALTIGGGYFGAIGMIIAVPIAALLSVYVQRYYNSKSI